MGDSSGTTVKSLRAGCVVAILAAAVGCSGPFDHSLADMAPRLQSIRYVRTDQPTDQANAASVTLTIEHWSGCLIGGKRCESSSGTSERNLALAPGGPNTFDANVNAVDQIP